MKKVFFFICFIIPTFLLAQLEELPAAFPNPGNIIGKIHVSKKDSLTEKIPLVVVLHGCTQNAEEISENSDWNLLGDRFGFHVLYVEQRMSNNISTCFNWFESNDNQKGKGEVYSIERLVQTTIVNYKIDTSRIFVYGVSAGGAMTTALLVNYPSLFKAGAVLAGTPYGFANNALDVVQNLTKPVDLLPAEWEKLARAQNPTYTGKYPNVFIFHGTKDNVVPILSGYELSEQFLALHDLEQKVAVQALNFHSVKGLTRNSFRDETEEKVVFYEIKDWGHALMVKPGNGPEDGGKTGPFAKIGAMWSTLQIVKDFGLDK